RPGWRPPTPRSTEPPSAGGFQHDQPRARSPETVEELSDGRLVIGQPFERAGRTHGDIQVSFANVDPDEARSGVHHPALPAVPSLCDTGSTGPGNGTGSGGSGTRRPTLFCGLAGPKGQGPARSRWSGDHRSTIQGAISE